MNIELQTFAGEVRTAVTATGSSAFGVTLLVGAGENIVQRYEYTGRELASESNEYYFRYRTYGPPLGQFFTRDPLGYVDGMGLYGGRFAKGIGMDPLGKKQNMANGWKEIPLKEPDPTAPSGGIAVPDDKYDDFKCDCADCPEPVGQTASGVPLYNSKGRWVLTCSFTMVMGIRLQYGAADDRWFSWANSVKDALDPDKALYHKAVLDAYKEGNIVEIHDNVLKHERAHVKYGKMWYDSRYKKANEVHDTRYDSWADCFTKKSKIEEEMGTDRHNFMLWQYQWVHKENKENAEIEAQFPMSKPPK